MAGKFFVVLIKVQNATFIGKGRIATDRIDFDIGKSAAKWEGDEQIKNKIWVFCPDFAWEREGSIMFNDATFVKFGLNSAKLIEISNLCRFQKNKYKLKI